MVNKRSLQRLVVATWLVALMGATMGCGADSSTTPAGTSDVASETGIRVVPVAEAANILEAQPPGLVVLDVRTPQEFSDGHLEGAVLLDFYAADFQTQLADLDRDAPYLLYCRSGNRSSQAASMMKSLGFTDVRDVDGGILAWDQAGLPTVG